jgi:hypothetical protein
MWGGGTAMSLVSDAKHLSLMHGSRKKKENIFNFWLYIRLHLWGKTPKSDPCITGLG